MNFAQQSLCIPPANYILLFFNYYYDNILHQSIISKEKNIKIVKNMDSIIEEAIKIVLLDKSS
jgi:hypothetical protein